MPAITTLEEKVDYLFAWVLKQERISSSAPSVDVQIIKSTVNDTWMREKEAAAICGYAPITFRRKVKAGHIDIHYRHSNGRKYEYKTSDLMKYKNLTSTNI